MSAEALTTLAIIIGIVAFSMIGAVLIQITKGKPAPLPQDTFRVTTPTGEVDVVGYLYVLPSGVLTFQTPDRMFFRTFGIGGWWHVVKIGEGAQ